MVLLFIFFSGSFISPAGIVALSSPKNDHKVILTAIGIVDSPVVDVADTVLKFSTLKRYKQILLKVKS